MIIQKNVNIEVAADHESKIFSDGSSLVRAERLPWTQFPLLTDFSFKLLYCDWERDYYVVLFRGLPGAMAPEHYHFDGATGYCLKGQFGYEYGTIFAGDYFYESGDILHQAEIDDIPNNEILLLLTFFTGLGGLKADGTPDVETLVDGATVYELAKANGAADHISPPPANYKKAARWTHAKQYATA